MNISICIDQQLLNAYCHFGKPGNKAEHLELSQRIQDAVSRLSALNGVEEPLNPFSRVHRLNFTQMIPYLKEAVPELKEGQNIARRYWNTWCKNVFKGPVLDGERNVFQANPKLMAYDFQKKLYEENEAHLFYQKKGMYRSGQMISRILKSLNVDIDDSIKELSYYDEILRKAIREHNAEHPENQVYSNPCQKGFRKAFSLVLNGLSAKGAIKNFTEKQLRQRWENHASPDIIDVKIREEDESKILSLFPSEGKLSWSDISRKFCERFGEEKFYYPANSIKNFYHIMQGRQKSGVALDSSCDSSKPKVVKKRTTPKRKTQEIEETSLVASRFIKQKTEESLTSLFGISEEFLSNNREDDDLDLMINDEFWDYSDQLVDFWVAGGGRNDVEILDIDELEGHEFS